MPEFRFVRYLRFRVDDAVDGRFRCVDDAAVSAFGAGIRQRCNFYAATKERLG